jgi:hypothetical protein
VTLGIIYFPFRVNVVNAPPLLQFVHWNDEQLHAIRPDYFSGETEIDKQSIHILGNVQCSLDFHFAGRLASAEGADVLNPDAARMKSRLLCGSNGEFLVGICIRVALGQRHEMNARRGKNFRYPRHDLGVIVYFSTQAKIGVFRVPYTAALHRAVERNDSLREFFVLGFIVEPELGPGWPQLRDTSPQFIHQGGGNDVLASARLSDLRATCWRKRVHANSPTTIAGAIAHGLADTATPLVTKLALRISVP